jgi:hypothetical protein
MEDLTANEGKAHSNILKFMRIFMKPEYISLSLTDAVELCQDPR